MTLLHGNGAAPDLGGLPHETLGWLAALKSLGALHSVLPLRPEQDRLSVTASRSSRVDDIVSLATT